MTTDDTTPNIPSKRCLSALQMGHRKKASTSDPLISHGHHFGRTVFALYNYPSLLTNGILRLEQLEDNPLDDFPAEEQREHHVFKQLLDSYPGLLETRFNHDLTGSLLCPAGLDWNDLQTKADLQSGEMLVCGDQWPIFLYAHQTYDPNDLWCGLLRSRLLVSAYKHIFTNAHLHGMNSVTIASIAYIATQVRFALSSSSVFLRTDTATDSETFYHSLLDLLEDPDESREVDELLAWWNRYYLHSVSCCRAHTFVLSKIRQKCLALKQISNPNLVS
ncbi:hypothetical protein C8R48DRAFT_744863 [Suillus tomentosus]|nr:hypothetical protein C8R48DRAFT_744863 [Suillus tomentosus]